MEVDLQLKPEQEAPWCGFADKVRLYASDRARARVAELENIRIATATLYATFTADERIGAVLSPRPQSQPRRDSDFRVRDH